jgi:hypothetical protein
VTTSKRPSTNSANNIAVEDESRKVTYRELDALANRYRRTGPSSRNG